MQEAPGGPPPPHDPPPHMPPPPALPHRHGPEAGRVYLADGPYSIYRTAHPHHVAEIQQRVLTDPTSVVFAHAADLTPPASDLDAHGISTRLRDEIRALLGPDRGAEDVNVVHIRPANPDALTLHAYAVYGLSPVGHTHLADHSITQVQGIPAHFTSASTAVTQEEVYLGAVEGFFPNDTDPTNGNSPAVNTFVRDAILSCPVIAAAASASDDAPAFRTWFRDAIRIRAMRIVAPGGQLTWVRAAFVRTRYTTWQALFPFLTSLRQQLNSNNRLISFTLGNGTVNHTRFRCRRCRASDHPATHCFFPLLPNWAGDPPIAIELAEPAANADPPAMFDIPEAAPAFINPAPRGRGMGRGRANARGGIRGRGGRGRGRGRGAV